MADILAETSRRRIRGVRRRTQTAPSGQLGQAEHHEQQPRHSAQAGQSGQASQEQREAGQVRFGFSIKELMQPDGRCQGKRNYLERCSIPAPLAPNGEVAALTRCTSVLPWGCVQ